MIHIIDVKTRYYSGAYIARYAGKQATNTASAEGAVRRLAGKVFGTWQHITVTRIDGTGDYMASVYRVTPDEAQKCRVCGCSYSRGCAGGCHWVAADLCSCCAPGEG